MKPREATTCFSRILSSKHCFPWTVSDRFTIHFSSQEKTKRSHENVVQKPFPQKGLKNRKHASVRKVKGGALAPKQVAHLLKRRKKKKSRHHHPLSHCLVSVFTIRKPSSTDSMETQCSFSLSLNENIKIHLNSLSPSAIWLLNTKQQPVAHLPTSLYQRKPANSDTLRSRKSKKCSTLSLINDWNDPKA